MDVPPIKQTPF
jgi:hypothetical protein